MGRRAGCKNMTQEERQAMVQAVQQHVLQTGKKDIKAVCAEHPGWNRGTVSHYYSMYERGESLQPKRRRCTTDPTELVRQTALLPPTSEGTTRPAARALGVNTSVVQRWNECTQCGLQVHTEEETWHSRDADALYKIVYYLGLGANPCGSMDICHLSITEDRIAEAILEAHTMGCTIRMILDEKNARRNLKWLYKVKAAGIPVKTGRTATFKINNKWAVINGEFVLSGTFSKNAFNGSQPAMFETRTNQAHLDSVKHEFELLWDEGRVIQWAPAKSAWLMYPGDSEEGEDDTSEQADDRDGEDDVSVDGD